MFGTRPVTSAPIDSLIFQFDYTFIFPTYPRKSLIGIGPPALRSTNPFILSRNDYIFDTNFRFADYPNTCLIGVGPPTLRSTPEAFYIGSNIAAINQPPNTFFQFPTYPKLPIRIGVGPVPTWFSLPQLGYHTAVRLNFGNIVVYDGMSISDTANRFVGLAVSDNLTLTESVSFIDINKGNLQVSDTLNLTEVVSTAGSSWVRSLSDSITVTDSANRRTDIIVIDTIGIVETVTASDGKTLLVADAIVITENNTVRNTVQRVKDTLHLTDSVVINYARRLTVIDTINIIEQVAIRDLPVEAVVDTIDLGENLAKRLLPGSPIIDQVAPGEILKLNKVLNITIADCLTIIDVLYRVKTASTSDTITITEALRKFWAVFDTIKITETLTTNAVYNACHVGKLPDKAPLIDTLVISDRVTLNHIANITVVDGITPQDAAVLLP